MVAVKTNMLANKLINDMNLRNKKNCYGDPTSSYFSLLEDGIKNVAVAITREVDGVDNSQYYSVHYIDKINHTNDVLHTDSTEPSDLTSKLNDIIALVLYNYGKTPVMTGAN